MPDDRSAVAHLLRRTGFGPTPAEVDAATARGYAATVDRLLAFSGPDAATTPMPAFTEYSPLGGKNLTVEQRRAIQRQRETDTIRLISWWLNRMTSTSHPLREKITWFWHGHFATSIEKVQRADYMAKQNQILRTQGTGNFDALAQAVAKDPAMLVWLDAGTNLKQHPNENFARELMELFTLGIGNYTEQDIKEAARAFTGWHIDRPSQQFAVYQRQHDDGVKTVVGQTGAWTGEDVIHILTNNVASAPFIVSRVWSHFAYPVTPSDPLVASLSADFARSHDVAALMRTILLHPAFVSDAARTGLIKQPLEWVVGIVRALGLPASDMRLVAALRSLGQVPFAPPNVGGWPQNQYWLTTASSLARLRIAATLAGAADLTAVRAAAPADRPAAVGHLLSAPAWGEATRRALIEVAANPKAMLVLALVSPEYTLA